MGISPALLIAAGDKGGAVVQIETRTGPRGGLSLVLDVLAQPADAFRYMAQRRYLLLGLAVYTLSQVPLNLAPSLPFTADLGGLRETAPPTVGSVVGDSIFNIIGLIVAAVPMHIIARLFGGQNSYRQLLQAMGFAALPTLLVAPFAVVAHLADLPLIYLLALVVALAWSLGLTVIALRETYGFGTGRAVAVLAVDLIVTLSVIFGLGVLLSLLTLGVLRGI